MDVVQLLDIAHILQSGYQYDIVTIAPRYIQISNLLNMVENIRMEM
jgi:hypothetical protein